MAVAIDRELQRGTYTVAWRAISADSDPISGAWVFHVQAPGPQPSGIAAQVLEDTPLSVSAFYLGGRFLDFLLLLLCAGGIVALVVALRGASPRVRERLLALLAGAATALAVVALLGIVFQGAAAGGTSVRQAVSRDVVSSVADTRFGHVSLMRAAIAVALALLALTASRAGGRLSRGATGAGLLLGGLVISISSGAGVSGNASGSAYSASKFGLEGWMESIAGEVEPFGIQTMIVEPGFFRTELLTPESTTFGELSIDDYDEARAEVNAFWTSTNGKQAGDPAKLARALVQLADSAEPPLRWAAGEDVVEGVEDKARVLLAQVDAHRELSVSLAHEDAKVAA